MRELLWTKSLYVSPPAIRLVADEPFQWSLPWWGVPLQTVMKEPEIIIEELTDLLRGKTPMEAMVIFPRPGEAAVWTPLAVDVWLQSI